MTWVLLVSHLVGWVMIILLGLSILAMARQLGYVLIRTGPLGGAAVTDEGPALGARINTFEAATSRGRVRIPDRRGSSTLLVFVSESCSACSDLIPAVKTLAVWRDCLSVVVATVANAEPLSAAQLAPLDEAGIAYVAEPDLAGAMNVRGFPYAVLISEEGIVRAKGIVNNIVQLESLLETQHTNGNIHQGVGVVTAPAPVDVVTIVAPDVRDRA